MNIYELLRNVSRTFALSIEQLPPPLNKIITIAYLLFRISDTIEDHPEMEPERKIHLLNLWADILNNNNNAQALIEQTVDLEPYKYEIETIRNANLIIQELKELPERPRHILISNVCKTSLGMAKWQKKGPCMETEEEMDDYMHHVAGQVGYLLTDIFAWYSPRLNKIHENLFPLGHEFGLALQTVNILRGLRKDFERGWVFIPKTFFNKAGLSKKDLFEKGNTKEKLALIDQIINKAEKHLKNGLSYIMLIPRREHRIRLFCLWPLLFAVKTLSISKNNKKTLLSEAKISRSQVQNIVVLSSVLSWSNMLLRRYYYYLGKNIFQT